jgi:hypothetical protein
MDKKEIRKVVRSSVEEILTLTMKQMQSQEFADILCYALFNKKIDAGIHFKYLQEKDLLTSKHFEGFIDDITNQVTRRFHEADSF